MAIRSALAVSPRRELALTQRMRQALNVLQMDSVELAQMLEKALVDNPFLEEVSDDDASDWDLAAGSNPDGSGGNVSGANDSVLADFAGRAPVATRGRGWDDETPASGSPIAEESWQARIWREFRLQTRDEVESALAEIVLGSLDGRGYLAAPVATIAAATGTDPIALEAVRAKILRMEPGGVGARDLRECLSAQLAIRHPGDRLAARIVAEGLDCMARGRTDVLAGRLRAPEAAVRRAVERIRRLWPDPAGLLSQEGAGPVFPDLIIERVGERYYVSATERRFPRLRLTVPIPEDHAVDAETRAFLTERRTRARWLLASVAARRRTLLAVGRLVAKEQAEFFVYGVERLRPLSLRQAAGKLGLHESTVARAVRGKFVLTPRGVHALRFFFAKGVVDRDGRLRATPAVTRRIQELIAAEERQSPLTDRMIAGRLRREGIPIARRTVTKYRDSLRIPTAGFRRRG